MRMHLLKEMMVLIGQNDPSGPINIANETMVMA